MRKILAIFTALVMCISFTACGKEDAEVTEELKGEISVEEDTTDNEETEDEVTEIAKWQNEALGLGFIAPEGWNFLNENELKALNEASFGAVEGTDIADAISSADIYYDMSAQDTSGNSINVLFEKTDSPTTAEAYVSAGIEGNKTAFEQLGATDIEAGSATYAIGSNTYQAIKMSYTYQGVEFFCSQLCIPVENQMAVITITSVGTDATEAILSSFYLL